MNCTYFDNGEINRCKSNDKECYYCKQNKELSQLYSTFGEIININ